MKLLKKTIFVLYTLIVVCIGLATVIEKYHGTSFVSEHIYGAWWFSALWAVLTVAALSYFVKQRGWGWGLFLLHLSFVVILAGALTTHLTARRGIVHLRTGIPEMTYIDNDSRVHQLPFSIVLKEFRIVNYPGTDAPLDYQSVIGLTSGDEALISMNHIGNIDGYRLFQQGYDSDGEGVTLGIAYDPYGIAITYAGYLLLLVGIIATLFSRKTQMRALYRRAVTLMLLLFSINTSVIANPQPSTLNPPPSTVPADIAHRLGTVPVLYNNRICPLNTVATDFVTKLAGSASWEGYSADEIFVSWMIYYSPWEQQKLIRVKSRYVQQLLGISSQWACYADFLNEYHEYKLQDAVEAQRTGHAAADGKGLMEADEKFHTVEMFYRGQFTKIFPYRLPPDDQTTNLPNDQVTWYSPGGQVLPREIPVKEQFFIKQSMDFLTESIVTGQHDRALEIIEKIKLFQREMIGDWLPSESKIQAEVFYNKLRSQKWPVFLSLTLSLLLCVLMLIRERPLIHYALCILNDALWLFITLQLALRWWLSGHIPVSNGPETMLFMAWVVLLLTIGLTRKCKGNHSPLSGRGGGGEAILAFGPLIASFCMLVAMLGGSSSQLTPLMPVLQSPLLSIHVMTVMCAYALFALQMLLGIYALIIRSREYSKLERVTALSQFLLYPAVFLLAVGIFLGAVWANVSWGCYWSWDPKESWALITLMVYAVPLHKSSVGRFRNPRFYHIYMVCAFLAVLITYFGVNYLLGGMHSYA